MTTRWTTNNLHLEMLTQTSEPLYTNVIGFFCFHIVIIVKNYPSKEVNDAIKTLQEIQVKATSSVPSPVSLANSNNYLLTDLSARELRTRLPPTPSPGLGNIDESSEHLDSTRRQDDARSDNNYVTCKETNSIKEL